MRKILWMATGAAMTYFVMMKGRQLMHKLTPQGMAEQVEAKGQEAAASVGEFVATYKAARDAKERELSGIIITQPEIDR